MQSSEEEQVSHSEDGGEVVGAAVDPLERFLDISIDSEALEARCRKRFAKAARSARMPGFRPGKVPLSIIEKEQGVRVREEELNQMLRDAFDAEISKAGQVAAGIRGMQYSGDEAAREQGNLIFSVCYDEMPEIVLPELAEKRITKPVLELDDESIDRALELLRLDHASYQKTDGAIEKNSKIIADYHATLEGESFEGGDATNVEMQLGRSQWLADFEAGVLGAHAGEDINFSVKFPEGYTEQLSSKTGDFAVKIHEVYHAQLPELDEAFLEKLGVNEGGIEALRQVVADNLTKEVQSRTQASLKRQVLEQVLEDNVFPVPTSLVEMDLKRLQESAPQEETADSENFRERFWSYAESRVRHQLLFSEFVKKYEISVSRDEVLQTVTEDAKAYDDPNAYISWICNDQTRVRSVASKLIEERVVEHLIEEMQLEDESKTLDEMMSIAS